MILRSDRFKQSGVRRATKRAVTIETEGLRFLWQHISSNNIKRSCSDRYQDNHKRVHGLNFKACS